MSSLITDEMRAKATQYYKGDEICRERSRFFLKEVIMPNGLLPLKDIEEVGYIEETGFVWLKQKKKCEHKFEKIGKLVQYAAEVTAYVDKYKIKKLTGVKAKELLMWVTINEISIDDPASGKIIFKTPTGLSRTFPASAFEVEEKEEDQKKAVSSNGAASGNGAAKEEVAVKKDAGAVAAANAGYAASVNGAAKEEDKAESKEKVEVKKDAGAAGANAGNAAAAVAKNQVGNKQIEVKEV